MAPPSFNPSHLDLRPRYSRRRIRALWLLAGLLGAHRFYLRDWPGGLRLALSSLGGMILYLSGAAALLPATRANLEGGLEAGRFAEGTALAAVFVLVGATLVIAAVLLWLRDGLQLRRLHLFAEGRALAAAARRAAGAGQ